MASRDKGAKIFLRAFCALFLGTALLGLTACTAIKNMGKTVLKGRINPEEVVTGLPVMRIRTGNGRAVTGKTEYVSALIEITDPDGGGDNPARPAAIRGRGNTSWDAPKKPYRIKFDKKTSLFGRPAAKSWVLLANYQDTTLFLNSTAFELGKLFNLPFTPHYDHVELVLNGRYEGSYVLTNQIQAGTGRVDIDKDRGFLVELDTHYDEDPKFTTPVLQMPVMIKHPEDTEDGPRIDSVKNALYELEAALFDDSFPDNHYRDLINIDVFVDYIMINEITRNVDIQLPHSVYLYRDGGDDSKIGIGPLWDFDYGFDYLNGNYFNDAAGMYRTTAFREGSGQKFFARFFDDPYFREKYKNRWNEMYDDIAGMTAFIDQMAERLYKSQELNYRVWRWQKVDYKKEVERMKTWWGNRIAYLHSEINRW